MLHLRSVGLRGRLIALVLLILLPLISLQSISIYGRMGQREDAVLAADREFADAVGVAFLRYLDTLWATELALGEAIVRAGHPLPPDEIETLMAAVVAQHLPVARMAWINPQGTIEAATLPSGRGVSVADRDYIQRIVRGEERTLSGIQTARVGGEPSLMVASGIRRGSELKGILVAIVDPDQLGSALDIDRAGDAIFGLVDPLGNIVYRSGGAALTSDSRFLPADSPARKALTGEVHISRRVQSQIDGVSRLLVAVPVKGVGWAVFSATPNDSVIAAARREAVRDLVILLLVAAASLLAAATLGDSVLRPLLAIRQAARDVSRGNMGARAASLGGDEVAVTAQTFNEMVDQIQRTDFEVRLRASQQAMIAQLGQRALAGANLADLMDAAVARTADMLGVEFCKVLQLLPDGLRLKLQAGVGWRPGLVGTATIGVESSSQAGYTLLALRPVVVEDLAAETRFSGTRLLTEHKVVSGVSVVIGSREQPFGVLGVHTAHRRSFTDDDVNFLQAVANVLAAAVERAQAEEARVDLLKREKRARTEAEGVRQRVALLAEAGVMLSNSLEFEETLNVLTSFIVPGLADWCTITMLDRDGHARRVAAAHRDPDRLWLVQELNRFAVPGRNGVGEVLSNGRSVLHAVVDDALMERQGSDQLWVARALAIRSTMIIPLIARGRTLGAISFARSSEEQPYDEQDLAFAEELAHRAAVALDNARLYQEAQEAMRHKDESYALLDTLLNSAPVGFAFLDTELQVVQVNQALATMGQRSVESYRGRSLQEVLPRLSARFEPLLRSVLETGQPVLDFALSLRRYWLCSCYPVRTAGGQVLGVGVVVTDITDQQRMEEALRESEGLLAGQNRILEMIATGQPREGVLAGLSQFVEEQSAESSAALMLLERTGNRLFHAAPPGLPEPFWRALDGLEPAAEASACGAAVHRRELVVTADIGTDPLWEGYREQATAHGVVACWAVPILATNCDVLGLLAVYAGTVRTPGPSELTAVRIAARLAGLAVERWQAEQARVLKLQSLFQNMVEGVIAVNEDGRIWLVNEAASALLNLDRSMEGELLEDASLPALLAEMLSRAASGVGAQPATLAFACGDLTVDAHVAPVLSKPGSPFGAIGLLQDSTAQAQFRHLQETFVANVSHELRGPLTTLSAMVEAMADGVLPEWERPRYLRATLAEIGRLHRLTRDLLELSRLDAGMVELEVEEFDLALLLHGLETKWGPRCTGAGLALSCQGPELRVRADVDRLEQILSNLLDNAIRFTPPGGQITVMAAPEAEMVRVAVLDTGPGIPREHLPYVWERFYKADQARTRTPDSGTGLGLAIAREWVVTMGGQVHVASEPGQGAMFSFTLPLAGHSAYSA